MAQVIVKDNFERSVGDFKKEVQKDGILRESLAKRCYLSKGERRRKKKYLALLRSKKRERPSNWRARRND